ncbi:hypothetical protein ACFU98_37165 [Streptomyces sp. NPDC057575]|uniref:hypothetical protein n=1 Tax=unclassified Streptomyces TaxID=2593676 RepID=UPI0036C6B686
MRCSPEPGGTLELVHWRRPVADHAQSAEAVHQQAARHPALVRIAPPTHTEPDFLLDVFTRPQQPGTPPERPTTKRNCSPTAWTRYTELPGTRACGTCSAG